MYLHNVYMKNIVHPQCCHLGKYLLRKMHMMYF